MKSKFWSYLFCVLLAVCISVGGIGCMVTAFKMAPVSMAAVAAFCLLLAMLGATANTLAMVYGVVYAIGVPIQTIGMPLITADLFGQRDEASILGVLVAISTVGYAVGTPMVNLFYDHQGTYRTALVIMAAAMAVASVAIVVALQSAKKLRMQISESTGG